jgi:hypothetical protein
MHKAVGWGNPIVVFLSLFPRSQCRKNNPCPFHLTKDKEGKALPRVSPLAISTRPGPKVPLSPLARSLWWPKKCDRLENSAGASSVVSLPQLSLHLFPLVLIS